MVWSFQTNYVFSVRSTSTENVCELVSKVCTLAGSLAKGRVTTRGAVLPDSIPTLNNSTCISTLKTREGAGW